MEFDTITEIYSSFNPFEPPDPEVYVDFESVRGGWNIDREVGRKITRSKKPTCQLYSGHRGAGKTTELLRLCETLKSEKFFVVYFAADEEDIEPQDTTYADILLACTRHLVQGIRPKERDPILAWMGDRWQSLKGLAQTEIKFEGLNIEQQLNQFTKLTANLRAVPDIRAQLRQEINTHTVSLVNALNEFIDLAKKELTDKRGIAIVADNLDRIAEVRDETHSNYDEIYLNRSEQLRGIGAHVIYTVPISLVYSHRGTRLEDIHGEADVVPMIMVANRDGSRNDKGMAKMRELVTKRLHKIDKKLAENVDTQVFESEELLDCLCEMSGGHVRNLMQMIQKAIDWTDTLPIREKAVKAAFGEARSTYRDTIEADQWTHLARVHKNKDILNDDLHRWFQLSRCVLRYRYFDNDDILCEWYDVHPLVLGISQFKKALEEVK